MTAMPILDIVSLANHERTANFSPSGKGIPISNWQDNYAVDVFCVLTSVASFFVGVLMKNQGLEECIFMFLF